MFRADGFYEDEVRRDPAGAPLEAHLRSSVYVAQLCNVKDGNGEGSNVTYGILFLMMTAAGIVQAITGMGYGMLCMSVLTFFFPYIPIMLALKILTMSFAVPVLLYQRDKIQWNILLPPVLFSIPGYYLSAWMLRCVQERELKIFLGVLVVGMALFNLLLKKSVRMRATPCKGAVFGLITGFFAASTSIAGPPMAVYYLNTSSLAEDKDRYYATTIMTFLLISLYQFVLTGVGGGIPTDTWRYILIGLIPTQFGIWVGKRILAGVDASMMRRLACLVMIAAGSALTILNLKG